MEFKSDIIKDVSSSKMSNSFADFEVLMKRTSLSIFVLVCGKPRMLYVLSRVVNGIDMQDLNHEVVFRQQFQCIKFHKENNLIQLVTFRQKIEDSPVHVLKVKSLKYQNYQKFIYEYIYIYIFIYIFINTYLYKLYIHIYIYIYKYIIDIQIFLIVRQLMSCG